MITAGHCSDLSPIGDWVHPLSGDSFGHVKNRDGYPEHDFEVVGENWIGQKARIYVTDNAYDEDWANVINAWDPSPGTPQYCWSGATTYVNCGFAFVSNPPSRWCPPGDLPGGWLYPVDSYGTHCNYSIAMMCSDETDFGPRGGDSGAPVYKAYSATEVGIRGIVVGVDAFGACGYVELLSEILATNPGMTVKTIP
jgi:hypothetical protein